MKWIASLHDIKRLSMTRRDHQDAKEQSVHLDSQQITQAGAREQKTPHLSCYINFNFHGTILHFLKYTAYRESKMIKQNNLFSVFDRNIRFGTVTKNNNCFYKFIVCMSVISSCVWASKPILTEFAPARILGQHIWTREIILRKLGPTPFKTLPKTKFLIFYKQPFERFWWNFKT